MDRLTALRNKIDEIDEDICKALEKRFAVVKEIGDYKAEYGIGVRDEVRESAVYEHIARLFNDEKQKNAVMEIYRSIISQSSNLQK